MAHQKTRLAIQVEYFSLRAILWLLQVLPYSWSRVVCRGLLQGVLQFLPKRRRLIVSQLAACFPERSAPTLQTLARQSINTLADGLATFIPIPLLHREAIDHWVRIEGF